MIKNSKKTLNIKDKILYHLCIIISAILPCVFLCGYLILKPVFFVSSDEIIACRGTPLVVIFSIPFLFFLSVSVSFFVNRYDMRVPFFQKKEKKNFSTKIKNKEALQRIKLNKSLNTCKVLCIIFLCIICLVIPTFSRTVITSSGEIIEYNIINKETCRIEKEQIMEIKIIKSGYLIGSNSQRTTISIITNNNKTYSFSAGCFEKNGLSFLCDLFDTNIISYEDKT